MPYLAYRTSNNQIIPDFQRYGTAEGLLTNAMRAGIPKEDINIRSVSLEEFAAIEEAYYADVRAQAQSLLNTLIGEGLAHAQRLGLDTSAKAQAFIRYLRSVE